MSGFAADPTPLMRFLPEPAIPNHATRTRCAVLLVNLGTPEAPTAPAVRTYLREFLSDGRVVEIPRAVWWLILNGIILPIRARQSAAKYAAIWDRNGSPLKIFTAMQAKLLRGLLGERGQTIVVDYAMRYGKPALPTVLARLKAEGVSRILILPLYPQYSATTTASSNDEINRYTAQLRNQPELRFVRDYHDHPEYIGALAQRVRDYWKVHGEPFTMGEARVVFSFHGIPQRSTDLGDPYYHQCLRTGRLLIEALGLTENQAVISFQSRFGKARWLQPYTAQTLTELARSGIKRVDVFCPGFPADCLETLEEVAVEGKQLFLQAGGSEFRHIPCLNDHPRWIAALASIASQHLQGWPLDAPGSDATP